MNDSAILGQISDGNRSALIALYDRHCSMAYGLALRLVGDQTMAEEVVLRAFVAIWNRAGSVNPAACSDSRLLAANVRVFSNLLLDPVSRTSMKEHADGRTRNCP